MFMKLYKRIFKLIKKIIQKSIKEYTQRRHYFSFQRKFKGMRNFCTNLLFADF